MTLEIVSLTSGSSVVSCCVFCREIKSFATVQSIQVSFLDPERLTSGTRGLKGLGMTDLLNEIFYEKL